MGLTQLTAATEEPLTLAEVKAHLRVEHNDEDVLIAALIATARDAAESRTGRSLVTQQWRATLDAWPADGIIVLPRPPLASVQDVTYLDSDGARQTVAVADTLVTTDTLVGDVRPAYGKSWPSARQEPGSIRVDYTAGYGLAAAVPQGIKAWMLLAIGTWYAQREAVITGTIVAELPRSFWQSLLDPYIVHTF